MPHMICTKLCHCHVNACTGVSKQGRGEIGKKSVTASFNVIIIIIVLIWYHYPNCCWCYCSCNCIFQCHNHHYWGGGGGVWEGVVVLYFIHIYCLVGRLSMLIWTYALLGVLYACVYIFEFVLVRCSWACFTRKGALEIQSLSLTANFILIS